MTTQPKAPPSNKSAKLTFQDGKVIDLPIIEGKVKSIKPPISGVLGPPMIDVT
jgi:hypothetical protein